MLNNEQYEKAKELFRLNNIVLNVTDRCNLRCKYCFTSPNPRVLTLDKGKKIIKWALEESHGNKITINFFGGEPMLEFKSLIKPLIEWGEKENLPLAYGMTTNGTLLTQSNISWLAEKGVNILLSIDGGPETQNANRPFINGAPTFQKVCENIPFLLHYMPYTIFRSTLEPENIDLTYENYLWAKELGFRFYNFVPNEFNSWNEDDLLKMAEVIRKIFWSMYNQVKSGEEPTIFLPFDSCVKKLFSDEPPTLNLIGRCGLGTSSVGIGTNGEIFGCQEYNTKETDTIFYLGNVFDGGIDENKRKSLIEKFLDGNPTEMVGCIAHNCKVCGDLCKTSEVLKVFNGSCLSSIAEILDYAAKNND